MFSLSIYDCDCIPPSLLNIFGTPLLGTIKEKNCAALLVSQSAISLPGKWYGKKSVKEVVAPWQRERRQRTRCSNKL